MLVDHKVIAYYFCAVGQSARVYIHNQKNKSKTRFFWGVFFVEKIILQQCWLAGSINPYYWNVEHHVLFRVNHHCSEKQKINCSLAGTQPWHSDWKSMPKLQPQTLWLPNEKKKSRTHPCWWTAAQVQIKILANDNDVCFRKTAFHQQIFHR